MKRQADIVAELRKILSPFFAELRNCQVVLLPKRELYCRQRLVLKWSFDKNIIIVAFLMSVDQIPTFTFSFFKRFCCIYTSLSFSGKRLARHVSEGSPKTLLVILWDSKTLGIQLDLFSAPRKGQHGKNFGSAVSGSVKTSAWYFDSVFIRLNKKPAR